MKGELFPGEKVVADRGYNVGCCMLGTDVSGAQQKILATVRPRQETVNLQFKQFFVPGYRFQHHISLHSACFHAVVTITQLMIERGNAIVAVEYTE